MLACMLVPLPTGAVDLLLSLSLAASVLLLVASLAVRRSVDFLTFPSLLLLVTLSRLALNVATTRLILSEGDAGRVIDAFAGLVVRGDLLVGAVMFAVITAVQFLVIARGSERVAEVAARFALDGLPGAAGGDRRRPAGRGDLGGGGGAAAGGAGRAGELPRGDGRGGALRPRRRDRGAGDHGDQPRRRGRGRHAAPRARGRREPRAVRAADDRRRPAGADPRAAGQPRGGRAGHQGRPRGRDADARLARAGDAGGAGGAAGRPGAGARDAAAGVRGDGDRPGVRGAVAGEPARGGAGEEPAPQIVLRLPGPRPGCCARCASRWLALRERCAAALGSRCRRSSRSRSMAR
jgi:hypothetical protein